MRGRNILLPAVLPRRLDSYYAGPHARWRASRQIYSPTGFIKAFSVLKVDNEVACVERVNGESLRKRTFDIQLTSDRRWYRRQKDIDRLILKEHIDIRGRSEMVL